MSQDIPANRCCQRGHSWKREANVIKENDSRKIDFLLWISGYETLQYSYIKKVALRKFLLDSCGTSYGQQAAK